jgi:lysophospholipase L1-like esterase
MRSKYLLLITSTIVTLLIAEITLRVMFHQIPGFHTYSQWFTPVDTLYSLKGFYADSTGVFKVDNEAADYLHEHLTTKPYSVDTLTHVSWDVYILDKYYRELTKGGVQNEFSKFINRLASKPDSLRDEFEAAVLEYTLRPINNDGFRSIAFKNYAGPRKKILLLGDSFTWGHSAENITSSFADILLSRGYVVYNTGISGADPEQYLAIAQQLVPVLKPDYVVVNFFMGNDIQYYERPIQPYMPFHYMTNASNLIACPHGTYFKNANEAYNFVYANYTIPPDNLLNRICAKTTITTLMWQILCKLNRATTVPNAYKSYYAKAAKLKLEKPVCNHIFKQLKEICSANNSAIFILSIPDLVNDKLKFAPEVEGLFENIEFHSPNVIPEDYNRHNGHYNNQGHKKHADLIQQLIEADQ